MLQIIVKIRVMIELMCHVVVAGPGWLSLGQTLPLLLQTLVSVKVSPFTVAMHPRLTSCK